MVERILEIFKLKNLSPSQFADEIGVQRSNISHLISGRNKPSLEFIQKIMNRFPDVNPEYILSGFGNILRDGLQTSLDLSSLSVKMPENQPEQISMPENQSEEPVTAGDPETTKPIKNKTALENGRNIAKVENNRNDNKIEKIVFFFNDKTFREYFPE